MASWSATFSDNNKYNLTLTVTEKSVDVANNKSTVEYKLVMATDPNSFVGYTNYRTQISCSVGGSVFTYDNSRDFNPTAASTYSETLCSGTKVITHEVDGTKTITCSASVTVNSGTYSPGSASISQSLTLTTIPRASTLTNGTISVEIGNSVTLNISAAVNTFKHKLRTVLGGTDQYLNSGNYIAAGVTSYSWSPTSGTWASEFPTQTSRTGTITLYTYDTSSNLIGSNAYNFTMTIPSSWKPTVTLTLSPSNTNAWLSSNSLYVAGYTKISAQATGSLSNAPGTTIASYTFTGSMTKTVNTTSTTPAAQLSPIITSKGSKSVTVKITDARGRTGTASASVSFLDYTNPSITDLSYARGTYSGGSWTSSDAGTDLRIVFKATCKLTTHGNNLASWSIGSPVSASGSNLSSGTSMTQYKTGIGTATRYTVKVTVTDQLGNSVSRSITVPTVEIPFVIDVNKPAIGVGAVPQNARSLEVASGWTITQAGYGLPRMASTSRNNNTQITIGIDGDTHLAFFTIGAYVAGRGGGVLICQPGNAVYHSWFNAPSGVTITNGTNQFTIANTSGGTLYIYFLIFKGNISIP